MKRDFDPLLSGEDAKRMLSAKRNELIERVRVHLKPKIKARTREWRDICEKVRS
jgi:hypothetical protein